MHFPIPIAKLFHLPNHLCWTITNPSSTIGIGIGIGMYKFKVTRHLFRSPVVPLRPPRGVCEANLLQAYKPCAIGEIPTKGLLLDWSNNTTFVSLVEISFTDPRGGLNERINVAGTVHLLLPMINLTTVSKNNYVTGFLGSFQTPKLHRPPCNKSV